MKPVPTVPEQIPLADGIQLRVLGVDDAEAVAQAVRESLEHLRPWMPWATEASGQVAFQRERLRKHPQLAARGEEWGYGLFSVDETRLLGAFGLTTRRGPGTMEIGYWMHHDACGQGHATQAVVALTEVAAGMAGVRRVLICCDEANVRSAAIPKRLGYTLERTEQRAPEAPGESGRMMIWALEPKK